VPKQSSKPPLRANCITKIQVKISANALIIMAKALAATSINYDQFSYAEAMNSPQHEHCKQAMEEECISSVMNKTFTTVNSREARQLRVKPIGSNWIYKRKHNPDGTLQYKAHIVIKGYEQTDF
jgi:hypothetical protein